MKNQKGMAIIMVLSTLLFVFLLIQETVFETRVEHAVSSKELHDLQAYYMAKAGMELSLLRIRTYNTLAEKITGMKEALFMRPYLDLMWRLPFGWPPLLVPLEEEQAEDDSHSSTKQKSLFNKGGYTTFLQTTGGRIDVNNLSSPIPQLKKWTYFILFALIKKLQDENNTLKALTDSDISKLLNNISDWIDLDSMQQTEAGISTLPENILYELPTRPLNRKLINMQELLPVKGMTHQLYQALKPFITVFGENTLNLNTLPALLMQSLHPDLNAQVTQSITDKTHKILNPLMLNWALFTQSIKAEGLGHIVEDWQNNPRFIFEATGDDGKVGTMKNFVHFNSPYNFKIVSIGRAGGSQKTITAIYIDWKGLFKHTQKLSNILSKSSSSKRGKGRGSNFSSPPLELNNPSIIYWKVSS